MNNSLRAILIIAVIALFAWGVFAIDSANREYNRPRAAEFPGIHPRITFEVDSATLNSPNDWPPVKNF